MININYKDCVINLGGFAMILLKLSVSGLPLFKGKCEIDFMPRQRVTYENAEQMSCVFSDGVRNFYKNNALSFIGINASGKTTLLKLISFSLHLLNNDPINSIDCAEILDELKENEQAEFEAFFYSQNNSSNSENNSGAVNYLKTVITRKKNKLVIVHETLKSKTIKKNMHKKDLLDFSLTEGIMSRQSIDSEFLLDDVSIMVAFNKRNNERFELSDMLRNTNINELSICEDCPLELIAFFDPSVEYLKLKDKNCNTEIRLKFKEKEEITLSRISELNRYLSSGTIKGINVFTEAVHTFKNGGYLIVDELENHFNHEIVSTLIRFYMDKKVNSGGATLIFSTHYPELLDEFDRNDNIYIIKNRMGITAENLSVLLKRNDIKKSEAYQSDFLDGTVPAYEAYMDLKKSLIKKGSEG